MESYQFWNGADMKIKLRIFKYLHTEYINAINI